MMTTSSKINSQDILADPFRGYPNSYYSLNRQEPWHDENKIYKTLSKDEQVKFLKNILSKGNFDIDLVFQNVALLGEPHEIDVFLDFNVNPYTIFTDNKTHFQYSAMFVAVGHRKLSDIKQFLDRVDNLDITFKNMNLVIYSLYKRNPDVSHYLTFEKGVDLMIDKNQLSNLIFTLNKKGKTSFKDKWIFLSNPKAKEVIYEYARQGYNFNKIIPEINMTFVEAMEARNQNNLNYLSSVRKDDIDKMIQELKSIQLKSTFDDLFNFGKERKIKV